MYWNIIIFFIYRIVISLLFLLLHIISKQKILRNNKMITSDTKYLKYLHMLAKECLTADSFGSNCY